MSDLMEALLGEAAAGGIGGVDALRARLQMMELARLMEGLEGAGLDADEKWSEGKTVRAPATSSVLPLECTLLSQLLMFRWIRSSTAFTAAAIARSGRSSGKVRG
jgi:hypothetical protein